jgi:hypothetical protein
VSRSSSSIKTIAALAVTLGLSGCGITYTTGAYFGDMDADERIDLMALVDTSEMQAVRDTAGSSRLLLYHFPGIRAQAESALAHVVSMRDTAGQILQSDLLPDMELYLLHIPDRAALVFEQTYKEPRSDESRIFGTGRYPLPYMASLDPAADFYYQAATYVLTHEMVELALVNELGNINHKPGCRWFFEGTANYVAASWQGPFGGSRTGRDARAATIWLWLLGTDILEWGEEAPEPAGYYYASTQAVTNLIALLEARGIEQPISSILDEAGPRAPLLEVIRDLSGDSFSHVFQVPDAEVEEIKQRLFVELDSENAYERADALELLQRMSEHLSDAENRQVNAVAAEVQASGF